MIEMNNCPSFGRELPSLYLTLRLWGRTLPPGKVAPVWLSHLRPQAMSYSSLFGHSAFCPAPPVAFLQNVNHREMRKHLSGPVPPRVSPTDVNTPRSEHGTVQWEREPHKKYGLFCREGAKVRELSFLQGACHTPNDRADSMVPPWGLWNTRGKEASWAA